MNEFDFFNRITIRDLVYILLELKNRVYIDGNNEWAAVLDVHTICNVNIFRRRSVFHKQFHH